MTTVHERGRPSGSLRTILLASALVLAAQAAPGLGIGDMGEVTADDIVSGSSQADLEHVTVIASHVFSTSTAFTFDSFGVMSTADLSDTQIDQGASPPGSEESITFEFDDVVTIDSITIGLLYKSNGLFGDVVNEEAQIQTLLDSVMGACGVGCVLEATDGTTATWDGAGGPVTNLSSANAGSGAGVWEIDDPFDGEEIDELVFLPSGGSTSEYSIVSVKFTVVPEPSTTAMLALGLLGIARLGGRRR